jgi:hypothetical protein
MGDFYSGQEEGHGEVAGWDGSNTWGLMVIKAIRALIGRG